MNSCIHYMHTFVFILTNLRVLHFKNIYSIQKKKYDNPFCIQINSMFLPSEVYISGVRGISTTQISAASSQRIEVTCDADACGAKVWTDDLSIPGLSKGRFLYLHISTPIAATPIAGCFLSWIFLEHPKITWMIWMMTGTSSHIWGNRNREIQFEDFRVTEKCQWVAFTRATAQEASISALSNGAFDSLSKFPVSHMPMSKGWVRFGDTAVHWQPSRRTHTPLKIAWVPSNGFLNMFFVEKLAYLATEEHEEAIFWCAARRIQNQDLSHDRLTQTFQKRVGQSCSTVNF